jgi:hypothetical protein
MFERLLVPLLKTLLQPEVDLSASVTKMMPAVGAARETGCLVAGFGLRGQKTARRCACGPRSGRGSDGRC